MSPILNSAGSITLLAFVLALSVYLRQVHASCEDRIAAILDGKDSRVWPLGAQHTGLRIALLQRVNRTIEVITPWMFALSCVCAARVFLYALSVFWSDSECYSSFLVWFDVLLSAAVFLAIVGMWIAHSLLRAEYARIKFMMEQHTSHLITQRRPPFED